MNKVSLIMPSLNVAPYIEECIESAINQTLQDIEIICVDAGSDDGTLDIIKKYTFLDRRIKLIISPVKSYGAQVNQGIEISTGEYIGVLETDDYIDKNMLESLYETAKKHNLDYVKADYTRFFTLSNGKRFYEPIKQFYDNNNLYNQVINPSKEDILYKWDANFWRGIYKKQFLTDNYIKFNESPGAAYQDIAFKEKILINATHVYYMDKPFYFYRTDRESASTYSINALHNAWLEFFSMENIVDCGNDIYLRGHYIYMVIVFVCEYRNTLIRCGYDANKPECSSYFWWFTSRIKKALENEYIAYSDFTKDVVEELKLLVSDLDKYVELIRYKNENISKLALELNRLSVKKIVVFGAGHWGKEIIKTIERKVLNASIMAFVDNSNKLQGKDIAGIPILNLDESIKLFPDISYIVANEKYSDEISEQLLDNGISRDKIFRLFIR